VPLCALKDVGDRLRVPLPSPSRGDPARIQRVGKLPQCSRACLLGLTDDWQHVGRVAIRLGLHGVDSVLAGLVELGVTEGDTASLGSR
jgi:hypothetical protein